MKKKYFIITGIIFVILVVITCSRKLLRIDRYNDGSGSVFINWVDCIMIDETTYTKNISNITVSESEIDKEIGAVKFELYDSIHYVGYKMKSWDATFLEVNTKIFHIKSNERSIAAFDDGIYYRYTR